MGTMGVSSLPKTVSRQRRDCDFNPAFCAWVQHANHSATELPSVQISCIIAIFGLIQRRAVRLHDRSRLCEPASIGTVIRWTACRYYRSYSTPFHPSPVITQSWCCSRLTLRHRMAYDALVCREETARSLTAGDVSKTKTKTTDRSRAQHREERRQLDAIKLAGQYRLLTSRLTRRRNSDSKPVNNHRHTCSG